MQVWEQFLKEQEVELGAETVQKWLKSLKIERFDACNLYLIAKDSFQLLWFEEHIRSKIHKKLFNANHKPIKVHISTLAQQLKPKQELKKFKQDKELSKESFKLIFDAWHPHLILDHFIFNESNQLVQKVLEEASIVFNNTASSDFNPIYLYGPSGCGKTHLLMSLAEIFQKQGLKTLYVRAETFTDHVVSAIRAGEMKTFRQAYRNADVLLVDDLHVFSRKGTTQEEFFHTFNTLHINDKKIILATTCAPNELQFIEPRLISRFEWGIVLPLCRLETEDLKKMLIKKGIAYDFPLPMKVIDFLIETFTSNPKNLVKAFEALTFRSHLSKSLPSSLSVVAVKTLLADLIIQEQTSALTVEKIIQAVSQFYGIRPEDILGKGQSRECALPRQIAMYLCRQKLKIPFMKIGDFFGRDHSTVMASAKQIQQSIENNQKEIVGALHSISKKLEKQQ